MSHAVPIGEALPESKSGESILLPKHAKPMLRSLGILLRNNVAVPKECDGWVVAHFDVIEMDDGNFWVKWTVDKPPAKETPPA